jgi:hypothetical protein
VPAGSGGVELPGKPRGHQRGVGPVFDQKVLEVASRARPSGQAPRRQLLEVADDLVEQDRVVGGDDDGWSRLPHVDLQISGAGEAHRLPIMSHRASTMENANL